MPRANATTDHQQIRRWVEARNGHPAVVRSTQSSEPGNAGLLRIDFDEAEKNLAETSWDEFFETFDANGLAFLYQDDAASGRKSRFNKFVSRDSIDVQDTEEDASSNSGNGRTRQASSAEQEEAEEVDEDDVLEEDEDFQDEDEDEDEGRR
jgi:hypothetical protein